MKTPQIRTAALLAFNAILSGTAWADFEDSMVDAIHPKSIEVLSNGVAYTQTAAPLVTLSASLVVNIDAGVSGRIKSWKAWLGANPEAPGNASANVSFSQHAHSESYPVGSRPKTVGTRGVGVSVPHGSLAPFLIGQCNWLANDLRGKGMSNQAIFSQDRTIPVRVWSGIDAEFSGIAGAPHPAEVGYHKSRILELVCKGHTVGKNPGIGPAAGGLKGKTEARLTAVNASVLHNSHPASCPTQATARVTFVADTDGPFTWRFTSASGKVSPPIRLEMRASDKQGDLYIRSYEQKFMVGEAATPAGGGGSGGGIGGSAVGGGFAGASRNDPDALPSGGAAASPSQRQVGAGYAAPSTPRLHQDALRAVVLNAAPGSVERSDAASYQVQCPVARNPGVGTPAGNLQGAAAPGSAPSGAAGAPAPGAVKTAPLPASQPPGVRQPMTSAGQRAVPTIVPATPVVQPPVPAEGGAKAPGARQPRVGALRRQAAE